MTIPTTHNLVAHDCLEGRAAVLFTNYWYPDFTWLFFVFYGGFFVMCFQSVFTLLDFLSPFRCVSILFSVFVVLATDIMKINKMNCI